MDTQSKRLQSTKIRLYRHDIVSRQKKICAMTLMMLLTNDETLGAPGWLMRVMPNKP